MNSITNLCLLIDKWEKIKNNSLSVTSHNIAKQVIEDLESLKEQLVKDLK